MKEYSNLLKQLGDQPKMRLGGINQSPTERKGSERKDDPIWLPPHNAKGETDPGGGTNHSPARSLVESADSLFDALPRQIGGGEIP